MPTIDFDFSIAKVGENQTQITVIVTCHQYGKYLAQCLASLTSQHFRAAQIFLVDDASTDETADIAASFPTVEYLRVEYKDVCASRDYALARVTTPWVLYVDADNWLQPRYLEFLSDHSLSCDSRVGVIYSSKKIFGKYDDFVSAAPYEEDRLDTQSFMDMCALIRVSALREVGGWNGPMKDHRGPSHDDWALWLRLRAHAWSFEPCHNALLYYRAHESNSSAQSVLQSPNTIIRNARFTLLTVLSGRRWNLSRYFSWLIRMDCVPEQVELVLLDNSQDPEFGREVRHWLAVQDRFAHYRYLKVDRTCDPLKTVTNAKYAEGGIPERLERDPYVHEHVAALYARAFSYATGDFLWTVEDDVIPEDDALFKLVLSMAWKRKAGAAGALVMSRLHLGQAIAGPLPISLDGNVHEVGFVSAGCTLYRVRALRGVRPRYEMTDTGALFWDVSVGDDMKRDGWCTLLDTGVSTKHYDSEESYV